MTEEEVRNRLKNAFNRVLNTHGYGFHYAVIKRAGNLHADRKSHWIFEATEVPVETQGTSTRIDFILQRRDPTTGNLAPFFMIAECKRVNPSLSNWCFVKSPYISRNRDYDPYVLEHVEVTATGFQSAVGRSYSPASDAYHIAVEIRSDAKGETEGKGRGGIEDAVAQVCRGLNGFVYTLPNISGSTGTPVGVDLLPVVFTTADLFVVDGDLSAAELSTGNIDLSKHELEPKDWIVLQYHMSPGLKHELARNLQAKSLAQFLDFEYIRSVPIVSHKGIGDFLWWASHFDLGWGRP